MKKVILFALLISSVTGCKKAIENIKEDMIRKIMTEGQWKISSFTEDGTELGADYADYAFKFNENETMDASSPGSLKASGSWRGDTDALTISTNFPGAANPLLRTNGTWKINSTTETTVNATQVGGSAARTMKLVKL